MTDVDDRWQRLDPLFILGMQRSGTSIVALAAKDTGRFMGFGEGHLWFEVLEPVARLMLPDYMPELRLGVFALGSGRTGRLLKELALAIDQFHRAEIAGESARWIDKSPGQDAVRLAPLLAQAFPQAQFVFVYRNGITTVNSAMKLWPGNRDQFCGLCGAWVKTMRNWRRVRGFVPRERFIEIAQERLAARPRATAESLATFLRVAESADRMGNLIATRRENSAFPDRPVGDYSYEIDWTEHERWLFTGLCGAEMAAWGYPVDFTQPAGPGRASAPEATDAPADMPAYYAWLTEEIAARGRSDPADSRDGQRLPHGPGLAFLRRGTAWLEHFFGRRLGQ